MKVRASVTSLTTVSYTHLVEHQVGDDLDVALAGFVHQAIEIPQGAVLRVDGVIVRNIVAEIHLRRRIEGRNPDAVHAEFLQVIQVCGDAV